MFTVVVVTFFVESSTISMILFRNVSLSRGKSTTRFGKGKGVIVFPKKSGNFHWTRNKTHSLPTKNSLKSAHLTIIILLE